MIGFLILILLSYSVFGIACKTDINESVTLTEDMDCNNLGYSPIDVTADNIIFDCDNYNVFSNESVIPFINITGRTNVTIKNCNFEHDGSGYAIRFSGINDYINIESNTFTGYSVILTFTGTTNNPTIRYNNFYSDRAIYALSSTTFNGEYIRYNNFYSLSNDEVPISTINLNGDYLELSNNFFNFTVDYSFGSNPNPEYYPFCVDSNLDRLCDNDFNFAYWTYQSNYACANYWDGENTTYCSYRDSYYVNTYQASDIDNVLIDALVIFFNNTRLYASVIIFMLIMSTFSLVGIAIFYRNEPLKLFKFFKK